MGWERGRYYTRSRKVQGRVVREYVRTGRVAERAARMDALEREQRRLADLALRGEKDELSSLDTDMNELSQTAELVARAALLAAGFHQHKRGEWRKRREQDRTAGPGQAGQA